MLGRAHARVARHGWDNVQLAQIDAVQLTPDRLQALGVLAPGDRFDAALCTLGLSVIYDRKSAWRAMRALVRPGGRVAVRDGGYPARPGAAGEVVALRPAAWFLCQVSAAVSPGSWWSAKPAIIPWSATAVATSLSPRELHRRRWCGRLWLHGLPVMTSQDGHDVVAVHAPGVDVSGHLCSGAELAGEAVVLDQPPPSLTAPELPC